MMIWKLRHSIEKILAHIELMNRFGKAIFFGSNQMFQVATKEEQEKIIMCRTLLQNAIILWNYLYLSELVSKLELRPELEELIDIIRNSTAVAWSHINLLGVYDFTKLLNDSQLRFDLQKLKEWKYKKSV